MFMVQTPDRTVDHTMDRPSNFQQTLNRFVTFLSKKFIAAGKNVVCEKTMCLNDKQTDEIYNLATEKKVFIMEAVWSRFMPVYKKLNELIESGRDLRTESIWPALDGSLIPRGRCDWYCPFCSSIFWISNNGNRTD